MIAAFVLSLAFVPAAHAAGDSVLAQRSQQTTDAGGSPSIIPSPNERGENNYGGLIVGVVLLGGWALTGYLLYCQAQRRRRAAESTAL